MADIIGQLAAGARAPPWRQGLADQLARIDQTARAAGLIPADLSAVEDRVAHTSRALGPSVPGTDTGTA